jgi:hypothetical protein
VGCIEKDTGMSNATQKNKTNQTKPKQNKTNQNKTKQNNKKVYCHIARLPSHINHHMHSTALHSFFR